MTFYPLDHLKIEHEYATGTWQDFTGDLSAFTVTLRELAGTHTLTCSFYNDAMDPSQGDTTHVIKKGDRVRVWSHNAALTFRKMGTFLVHGAPKVEIDLSKPPGRQSKVTIDLIGIGVAGVGGSGASVGVDTIAELSNIITAAPFEIDGDGFGSGTTAPTGTFDAVAEVDTATELDQILLTRDSNPGTYAFEDPEGAIQIFDSSTARTGAAAWTIGPAQYSKIDMRFDPSHVINVLNIKYLEKVHPAKGATRVVEHDHTYQDFASVIKYGRHPKTVTSHKKIDFAAWAADYFTRTADPEPVPTSVTIPIREAAELIPGYQDGAYVTSKVTVLHPDGTTAYNCRVAKIQHVVDQRRWLVTVFLRSPQVVQLPRQTQAVRTEVANNPAGTVQTEHLDSAAVTPAVVDHLDASQITTGTLGPSADIVQGDPAGNRIHIKTGDGGLGTASIIEMYAGVVGETPGKIVQEVYTDGVGVLPSVEVHSSSTPGHPHEASIDLRPTATLGDGTGGLVTVFADQTVVTGDLEVDGALTVNGSVVGAGGSPTGSIILWAGALDTVPDGWLACTGGTLSRTDWSSLFAVIGTMYGAGDGSTTYNLPNLQHKFPRGAAVLDTPGSTGGSDTVTLTSAQLPKHTHAAGTLATGGAGAHGHTVQGRTTGPGSQANVHTQASGSGAITNAATGGDPADHTHAVTGATADGGFANSSVTTTPPYVHMFYIIKT